MSALARVLATEHQETVDAIQNTCAISERGMLTAASALGAVVQEAMDQMTEAEALGKQTDGSLGADLAALGLRVTRYAAGLGERVDELRAGASEAVVVCHEISRAMRKCGDVVVESRYLSLLMKIEVSRLRDMQNMGFIAEELQSFSRGVEQLMEDVDGTTSDLLRDLQGLEECIDGLGRQREEDSTRLGHALAKVDDSAVAIERLIGGGDVTGTDPLGAILRSSQQALSSFQYHDPMAQDLQTIDALVAELRTAMSDDGDDSEILPLLYRKRIGDEVAPDGASSDGANGGDVFLF